ncbi:DUF5057 domain-containing protein [Paenibacillus tarimensis]|uniref:DUF5057 domain-containing protein n=1 Tax=Paenibacillus tarimensis TaxID=416012 RepID=UPI001F3348A2|nr:DUF5057 domain-containing protein [Paenibacillus tarimensis]MCF2943425.1 DUF5057 domain-containing protein [Paenibacillus tarimensis]
MRRRTFNRPLTLLVALSMIFTAFAVTGIGERQVHAGTGKLVSLQAKINAKYVTITSNGAAVSTSTTDAAAAELFELSMLSSGSIALKSESNGKYVSVSSTSSRLTAAASSIGAREQFTLVHHTDGTVSLIDSKNKYVCADKSLDSTTYPLAASKTSAGACTGFKLTEHHPVKILEITDTGSSDIQTILSPVPYIEVETMSMKRFVALRGDLDGKYDAIYIGKGSYNPETVPVTTSSNRESWHDTRNVMNDITQLKANEIIQHYINKGLLVMFYSDAGQRSGLLYQSPQKGKLYNTFSRFSKPSEARDNVLFINEDRLIRLAGLLTEDNYSRILRQRPKLVLSERPIDYNVNPDYIHSTGNTLTFKFNAANIPDFSQRRLTANLYIGLDQVLRFTPDQMVASTPVTGPEGELTYRLPKGYSGVHYWKLELVDQNSRLKDFQSGVIRFKDETTVVNVLQVMPNGKLFSSLQRDATLKQSYLKKAGEFEIHIDVTEFNKFNSGGYRELNGRYDMLIFGFIDEYNRYSGISDAAAEAVNAFIGTGQAVMFTHDTVFGDNNNWIRYFQDTTGQRGTQTNLGLTAPRTSTTTVKVNDGLLTQYPFNISHAATSVARTHNQYFTLDLEDDSIISWYNISGGSRDPNDSWNHYYTYSKGNVTYSGSGHVFLNSQTSYLSDPFPDWEEKLFVNTMYRAFIGSNHAPKLTVFTPRPYTELEDNYIPSYQRIAVSFKPEDWDLADPRVYVEVNFKYNGQIVRKYQQADVLSGSTVTQTFTNPLPQGGDLTVEVIARDKKGAKTIKEVPVKIKKIETNLTVSRHMSGLRESADGNGSPVAEKGDPLTVHYQLTPMPIPAHSTTEPHKLVIHQVSFRETMPKGIEITTLPSWMSTSGSIDSGYTISGTLPDVTYQLSEDGSMYTAEPIRFEVGIRAVNNGNYTLDQSRVSFRDIGETQTITVPFQPLSFQAITMIDKLSLAGSEIAVGEELPLHPSYSPADATSPIFTWESSNRSVLEINEIGTVKGIAPGTAIVTVRDAVSGLTAQAAINVVKTGLSINGGNTVTVGSALPLQAVLRQTANETIQADSVTWSFKNEADSTKAAIAEADSGSVWDRKLTGTKAGTVTVVVQATTYDLATGAVKHTYSDEHSVTIVNPRLRIAGPSETGKGEQIGLRAEWIDTEGNPVMLPAAMVQSVTWSLKGLSDASKARLTSGTERLESTLKAVEAGSVTVVVTGVLASGDQITAEHTVVINDRSVRITGHDAFGIGETINLGLEWQGSPLPPGSIQSIRWTLKEGEAARTASLSSPPADPQTASLTGNDAGSVTVVVHIQTTSGAAFRAEYEGTVIRLRLPASRTITQGSSHSLGPDLQVLPASMRSRILPGVKWLSSDSGIVSLTNSGIITGLKRGSTIITAIYRPDASRPEIRASMIVKVEPLYSGDVY